LSPAAIYFIKIAEVEVLYMAMALNARLMLDWSSKLKLGPGSQELMI